VTIEGDGEEPYAVELTTRGFRPVVYSLEEEPVALLSVTDENGESFGVEMTSSEALEFATLLRRAVRRPRPQEPPPE
jgi:hypothetical protein